MYRVSEVLLLFIVSLLPLTPCDQAYYQQHYMAILPVAPRSEEVQMALQKNRSLVNGKTGQARSRMGSTQTKEEVIISQAGNSGGTSNGTSFAVSWKEAMGIVAFCAVIIIIVAYAVHKLKKHLEKKIQQEIRRSQELIQNLDPRFRPAAPGAEGEAATVNKVRLVIYSGYIFFCY